jgi:hypothetical protein
MSATATSQEVRQPVSRLGGWIAGAIAALALAVIVVAALAYFFRPTVPAVTFDPTGAQRIHLVREYGSDASYDASGALKTHVLRENDAAPAGTLFDHVQRENQPD